MRGRNKKDREQYDKLHGEAFRTDDAFSNLASPNSLRDHDAVFPDMIGELENDEDSSAVMTRMRLRINCGKSSIFDVASMPELGS